MYKLLFLSLIVACSNKDATPSSSSSSKPATSLAKKLDCNNIVSQELRAKYFAKWELHDHPETIASVGECELGTIGGQDKLGGFTVDCHNKAGQDIGPSVKILKDTLPHVEDLAGVGRAAVISRDPTKTFVAAWDDDSGCVLNLRLPNAIDAAALAKDLMAYLPPK
jgi:hypothetical protein